MDGRLLGDGGLVANAPVELVLANRTGDDDLICFILDLFARDNGPPSSPEDSAGLRRPARPGERQIALMGHSIGGTFAVIFASLRPDRVSRLGLIDAPIAFADAGGPIAEAVACAPHARRIEELAGSPVAGSAIDVFSVGAVPEAFLLQRWADSFASLASP